MVGFGYGRGGPGVGQCPGVGAYGFCDGEQQAEGQAVERGIASATSSCAAHVHVHVHAHC